MDYLLTIAVYEKLEKDGRLQQEKATIKEENGPFERTESE